MPGCVVLVPYATHVEPACEAGLRLLEKSGYDVRRQQSSAAVDRTRSVMATRALDDGFDELMWIDSDTSFEASAVDRLRSHGLPLVGGVYAKKGVQDFALEHLPTTESFGVGDAGGLYDVAAVGFGFVLVRRTVFEAVRQHYSLPLCDPGPAQCIPYFLPMVVATSSGQFRYLSEDFAFCERARQAGHRIVVDSTIRLGHVGRYTYAWEDAGQAMQRVTGATFQYRR